MNISPLEKLHPALIANILEHLPPDDLDEMPYISRKMSTKMTQSLIHSVEKIGRGINTSNILEKSEQLSEHTLFATKVSELSNESPSKEYLLSLRKVTTRCIVAEKEKEREVFEEAASKNLLLRACLISMDDIDPPDDILPFI